MEKTQERAGSCTDVIKRVQEFAHAHPEYTQRVKDLIAAYEREMRKGNTLNASVTLGLIEMFLPKT